MRLVRTQARKTRHYLKVAEALVKKAILSGDFKGLKAELTRSLAPLSREAVDLVRQIALYEAEFTAAKIKKYYKKDIKYSSSLLVKAVTAAKVSVALNTEKQSIKDTYKIYADTKVKQLLMLTSDARVLKEEPEITISKLTNKVDGLFTTQNISLATIAIASGANLARAFVSNKGGFKVQWAIDLELNNCPDCEERDGVIFDADEVEGDIPLHARCGCTLIPVEPNDE